MEASQLGCSDWYVMYDKSEDFFNNHQWFQITKNMCFWLEWNIGRLVFFRKHKPSIQDRMAWGKVTKIGNTYYYGYRKKRKSIY